MQQIVIPIEHVLRVWVWSQTLLDSNSKLWAARSESGYFAHQPQFPSFLGTQQDYITQEPLKDHVTEFWPIEGGAKVRAPRPGHKSGLLSPQCSDPRGGFWGSGTGRDTRWKEPGFPHHHLQERCQIFRSTAWTLHEWETNFFLLSCWDLGVYLSLVTSVP